MSDSTHALAQPTDQRAESQATAEGPAGPADETSFAEGTETSVPSTTEAAEDACVAECIVSTAAPAERRSRAQIQTARLDSRDFRPSWPIAIASLEQLSGWAVLALRLGTLALIQQCVRELSEEKARADLIVRLRTLTDALAHMPLET